MAHFVLYILRILLTGLVSSVLQPAHVSALNQTTRPVTWGRLVSADPYVADIMAYCRTVNLDRTECAVKFLADTGPPPGIATKPPLTKRIVAFAASMFSSSSVAPPRLNAFMSSTVALKAAGNCIRQHSLLNTRLSNVYKIDFVKMREVASGVIELKARPGWRRDYYGRVFRWAYSKDVREKAAQLAKQSFWDQINAKRKADWAIEDKARKSSILARFAELESKWGPADAKGDKMVRLGQCIANLIVYGVGADDRATDAYNSPGKMGFPEDMLCYINQPDCIQLSTLSHVPPPEGPGANDYYEPPDNKPQPPQVDYAFPDRMNSHDFDSDPGADYFTPIPRSEPVSPAIVDVDPDDKPDVGSVIPHLEVGPFNPVDESDDSAAGIDEDNSTPVLHDFDDRTALQQCQEEQEQRIWHGIVITKKDPNAPTDEEMKNAAEKMLELGVCDKTYYGAGYCQAWRIERDSVPVDGDLLLTLYDQAARTPMCPVNLLSPEDCAHQAELLHDQLDCTQFFDAATGDVWAAPSLPAVETLDFSPPSMDSPGRFVPITEEAWLGNDWSAVGLAPLKPRIAGGKEAYEAIVAMNMKFPTGNDLLSAWIPTAGQPPIVPGALGPTNWVPQVPVGRLPGTPSSGHLDGLGSGWRPINPQPGFPPTHGEL